MRQAAARNVTGAIYGLILATSVIAVSRESESKAAGVTAVTVIVTGTVFWLAHVYADVLGSTLRDQRRLRWDEVRAVLSREWPLVQAGILPTLILLLGVVNVIGDSAAQDAALVACLAELAATGGAVAYAGGARRGLMLLSGAISLGLGLTIVALKVLVH